MEIGLGTISWARQLVAVDLGGETPVAVRARRRGRRIAWQPCSTAADRQDARSGEEVVVAGLPVGAGTTTWLATPLADVRKVRQVLPSLLDTKLPFALEDCLYAFSRPMLGRRTGLPAADAGTAALAVVVRRQDLPKDGEATGEERPWAAHVYDHEGIALWSGVAPARDDGVLRVVLWCRPSGVVLVLGVGRVYWSSHRVDGHDLDRVQQIIRRQQQSMAQGRYKDAAQVWYLGGGEALVAGLRDGLAGTGSSEVQILPDGSYYLARRLAERALLPGTWRLPLLVAPAQAAVWEGWLCRRYRRHLALLLGCAVVLLAGVGGRRIHLVGRIRQQSQTNLAMVEAITGYPVAARGQHAVYAAAEELALRRKVLAGFLADSEIIGSAGRLTAAVAAGDGWVEELVLGVDTLRLTVWLPEGTSADAVTAAVVELGLGAGSPSTEEPVAGRVRWQWLAGGGGAQDAE